jgi:hypothetical protein
MNAIEYLLKERSDILIDAYITKAYSDLGGCPDRYWCLVA